MWSKEEKREAYELLLLQQKGLLEMSIYIVCEYFEGYDVMVDFGDYTVTKYLDREKYAENIVGMADGYFECFDEPEERAGYAEKIRKYMLEGRSV